MPKLIFRRGFPPIFLLLTLLALASVAVWEPTTTATTRPDPPDILLPLVQPPARWYYIYPASAAHAFAIIACSPAFAMGGSRPILSYATGPATTPVSTPSRPTRENHVQAQQIADMHPRPRLRRSHFANLPHRPQRRLRHRRLGSGKIPVKCESPHGPLLAPALSPDYDLTQPCITSTAQ